MKITHQRATTEGEVTVLTSVAVEDEVMDRCVWAIRELTEEQILVQGTAPFDVSEASGIKVNGLVADWKNLDKGVPSQVVTEVR